MQWLPSPIDTEETPRQIQLHNQLPTKQDKFFFYSFPFSRPFSIFHNWQRQVTGQVPQQETRQFLRPLARHVEISRHFFNWQSWDQTRKWRSPSQHFFNWQSGELLLDNFSAAQHFFDILSSFLHFPKDHIQETKPPKATWA